jgi:hypothetical protein
MLHRTWTQRTVPWYHSQLPDSNKIMFKTITSNMSHVCLEFRVRSSSCSPYIMSLSELGLLDAAHASCVYTRQNEMQVMKKHNHLTNWHVPATLYTCMHACCMNSRMRAHTCTFAYFTHLHRRTHPRARTHIHTQMFTRTPLP